MFGCYLFGVSHGITFLIHLFKQWACRGIEHLWSKLQYNRIFLLNRDLDVQTLISKAWDRIFVIGKDDSKLQSRGTEECIKADKFNLRSIFICLCLITN